MLQGHRDREEAAEPGEWHETDRAACLGCGRQAAGEGGPEEHAGQSAPPTPRHLRAQFCVPNAVPSAAPTLRIHAGRDDHGSGAQGNVDRLPRETELPCAVRSTLTSRWPSSRSVRTPAISYESSNPVHILSIIARLIAHRGSLIFFRREPDRPGVSQAHRRHHPQPRPARGRHGLPPPRGAGACPPSSPTSTAVDHAQIEPHRGWGRVSARVRVRRTRRLRRLTSHGRRSCWRFCSRRRT